MNLFFKDQDINQPINVVYNGGSFTSFINVNPNYVLYDINPVTYVSKNILRFVLYYKIENYTLNIIFITTKKYINIFFSK